MTVTETQATLSEAIDCMLEGTAATKPCKNALFLLEDGSGYEFGYDHDEIVNAKYTCAEGAMVYGARLRGFDLRYIVDLIILLKISFENNYQRSHAEINDESNYVDPRDEVISMAKELL